MAEQYYPVCALEDIAEGGSRGFSIETASGIRDVFVVRREGRVFAYINSCPHTGGPLDWVPDQFLNLDGDYIQCATHAALFRIENGDCIAGPCAGSTLSAVPLELRDGQVMLRL